MAGCASSARSRRDFRRVRGGGGGSRHNAPYTNVEAQLKERRPYFPRRARSRWFTPRLLHFGDRQHVLFGAAGGFSRPTLTPTTRRGKA